MHSNCRPLVFETTALQTELQPLPQIQLTNHALSLWHCGKYQVASFVSSVFTKWSLYHLALYLSHICISYS